MRVIADAIGVVFFTVFVVWIVAIYMAPAEEKAVTMCRPVHYAVNGISYLAIAATGKKPEEGTEPAWKDEVRLWCLKTADRGIEAAGK